MAARERERLAHAVHDSVAHALTGILMGPQAASQRLAALEDAARRGLEEVRRVDVTVRAGGRTGHLDRAGRPCGR